MQRIFYVKIVCRENIAFYSIASVDISTSPIDCLKKTVLKLMAMTDLLDNSSRLKLVWLERLRTPDAESAFIK